MTSQTQTETRVTNWVPFGHYGLTHYRIWQHHSPMAKFQRHEWRREDGTSEIEDWMRVPMTSTWCSSATLVEEEAIAALIAMVAPTA